MERSTWTDERLSDMVARTESSFDLLRTEMVEMRAEMRDMRGEMRNGFGALAARIDETRRDMLHGFIATFSSIVALVAVLLAALLAQTL